MKKETLSIPGMPKTASYYAPMAKAGSFLFFAGQIAADPITKKIIKGFDDLPDEEGRKLASGDWHDDANDGPIMAQTWYVYQNLKRMLESQGSSLEHIVQATIYLTDMRRNFAPFNRVRRMFIKDPPPSTVIETPHLGVSDDVLLEITIIAVIPDEK